MQNAENFEITRNESVLGHAATADGAYSVDAIKSWLISELQDLLSVDAADLALDKPLVDYGLSSMTGMIFSGSIEDWLQIRLDPSVAWEYPTIEALAAYLADEVKTQHLSL